jgi:hypothetical protein
VLEAPGKWGRQINQSEGADIAVGEGQPLGAPMASGGPYFGFMCCRQDFVRQMPGRIVGRTVDLDGKPGFSLTLQAREQHIRRSKATSNICTNQGLVVTAATQYMALLGPQGLAKVAAASHAGTLALAEKLAAVPGVTKAFASPVLPRSGAEAQRQRERRAAGAARAEHPRRAGHFRLVPRVRPGDPGMRHRNQDRRRPRPIRATNATYPVETARGTAVRVQELVFTAKDAKEHKGSLGVPRVLGG